MQPYPYPVATPGALSYSDAREMLQPPVYRQEQQGHHYLYQQHQQQKQHDIRAHRARFSAQSAALQNYISLAEIHNQAASIHQHRRQPVHFSHQNQHHHQYHHHESVAHCPSVRKQQSFSKAHVFKSLAPHYTRPSESTHFSRSSIVTPPVAAAPLASPSPSPLPHRVALPQKQRQRQQQQQQQQPPINNLRAVLRHHRNCLCFLPYVQSVGMAADADGGMAPEDTRDGHCGEKAETLANWVQEYIDVDGGDAVGQEVVELDCESPLVNDYDTFPPTPTSPPSMAVSDSHCSAYEDVSDTYPGHDVNKGSATQAANDDPVPAADVKNDKNNDGNGNDRLYDPIFPPAWVASSTAMEPSQSILRGDLHTVSPIGALTSFASQNLAADLATASGFSFGSHSSLWSASNDPMPPSKYTPLPHSLSSTGSVVMSPSMSFSSCASTMARQASSPSMAAIAMSRNSSGGILSHHSYLLPLYHSGTQQQSHGNTPITTVAVSASPSAEVHAPALVSSSQDLNLLKSLSSSSSSTSFIDYNTLSSVHMPPSAYFLNASEASPTSSAQNMQPSLSVQSASSIGSCLSPSVRHSLFAPSMIPRTFLAEPLPITAGDNSGISNNSDIGNGSSRCSSQITNQHKRSRGPSVIEQGRKATNAQANRRKRRKTSEATADRLPVTATSNLQGPLTSEEPFDLNEFVHLPVASGPDVHTAPTVPVHPYNAADQAAVVLCHRRLAPHSTAAASEDDPLGLMRGVDPFEITDHFYDLDHPCYAAEPRPSTPNFSSQDLVGLPNPERGTVSPKDLHIVAAHPLEHHTRGHDSPYDHHDHYQDIDRVLSGNDTDHTNPSTYYGNVGGNNPYDMDDLLPHHRSHNSDDEQQHYHYPQPPQPHHALQAAHHRVPLPASAPMRAPVPAMEMHTPPPPPATLEPPYFYSSSSASVSASPLPQQVLQQQQQQQQQHQQQTTPSHPPPPPPQSSPMSAAPADPERARKDALLLKLRREGYTYQEIRRRYHFTEAESTMRGRFRVLTKPKEERVRKPQWTARDDQLLVAAVQRLARGRRVGREFRVPWKAVADSIVEGGGSYHFGNTTCRKRYDQLTVQGAVQGAEGSQSIEGASGGRLPPEATGSTKFEEGLEDEDSESEDCEMHMTYDDEM